MDHQGVLQKIFGLNTELHKGNVHAFHGLPTFTLTEKSTNLPPCSPGLFDVGFHCCAQMMQD